MGNRNRITVHDFKAHVANPDGTFDAFYDRIRFIPEKAIFEVSLGKADGSFSAPQEYDAVLLSATYALPDVQVDLDNDGQADRSRPEVIEHTQTREVKTVNMSAFVALVGDNPPLLMASPASLDACAATFAQGMQREEKVAQTPTDSGTHTDLEQAALDTAITTTACVLSEVHQRATSSIWPTRDDDMMTYELDFNQDGMADKLILTGDRNEPAASNGLISITGETKEALRTYKG